MIADPHRLFDCCLESDGACAVVVTTQERARDLAKPQVQILASEQGAPKGYAFGPFTNANVNDDLYATGGCREMADRLWGKAGLGPHDVDIAQLYDHFTGCVVMLLEDYGFCERGEGGPFVESGALSWNGGSLPPTRTAAVSPRLTFTDSTTSSRVCGHCAESPPARLRCRGLPGYQRSLRSFQCRPTGSKMSERFFPDGMPEPMANATMLAWWEAAAEHRLVVQRCTACQHTRLPPLRSAPNVVRWTSTGQRSAVVAMSTPTP